ncbi:MAG: NTP transferase domain-containing protein [Planctomycetaceae bacterium]|jgi:UTP--glucose-1-phosphate uridylyltransferase|nr:NTP transferase domain-containing protein [Planctomycetaceae bacterium]
MINFALIPVAGRGTSLLPLTKSQPKEMLPVADKPIVQYVVEELITCGVNRLLFITGNGKTAIENHFDINPELIEYLRLHGREDELAELAFEREAAEYCYMRQRYQLGLGHAVLCAAPFVGKQSFVVALGDTILGLKQRSMIVQRMITLYENCQHIDGIIAVDNVLPYEIDRYGIAIQGRTIDADGTFELKDLIEKPAVGSVQSCLAVAARYVFSPLIFDYIKDTPPDENGDIQLTDAIRRMLANGRKFYGVTMNQSERRYDIGSFESYFKAFADFAAIAKV